MMPITGAGNYNGAYEMIYAEKQSGEAKKPSDVQRKTDDKDKDSLQDKLRDKYSNLQITEGTFSQNMVSSGRGFQGVMISPAYLSKAEKDGETAKKLDEMLSGVESAYKWLKNAFAKDGLELVSCGYYIDENGNMGSYSLVEKKHSMFDVLAKQSEENAERIKEKQEKAKEEREDGERKAKKKLNKQAIGDRIDYSL